jgi:hypothetical protein
LLRLPINMDLRLCRLRQSWLELYGLFRCFDYCIFLKNKTTKIKIPYFIALFILAMILNTYLPQTALVAPYLVSLAKQDLL